MTDEELVKWLRNEHRKYVAGTTVTTTGYSQAADRIEALTAENERLRVSNEQWQVDYNEAVIDKLELETENHLLRVAAQRLGTYSAHDDDCRIMTHGVWSDPIPCTCGYADAWQAHLTAIGKQP
jgi:hypothetical protein